MVEVTPGIKSPPNTGFSIESIISRDSDPIARSPISSHHHRHHHHHGSNNSSSVFPELSPDVLSATSPTCLPGSRADRRSPLSGVGVGVRGEHLSSSVAMDVLRAGGALSASAGLASHHPHHPHFPVPVSSTHPHISPHMHSHLLSAAAASDSVSSFFSGGAGGKPLYSGLPGAGCGSLSAAVNEAGHSGLFPQSLSAFSGMSHGDPSSLSALHALSQKGLPESAAALHGLTGGASSLPIHGLHRQFPLYTWLSRPGFFHRYTGKMILHQRVCGVAYRV